MENWVEAELVISGLDGSVHDFMKKEAEGKKRWELHLKGLLPQDEFGGDEFGDRETRP